MSDPQKRADHVEIVREIRDRLSKVPGVVSVHHRERSEVHEVIVLLSKHDRTVEHIIVENERAIIEKFPGERFDFRFDFDTQGSMDSFLGWTGATRVRSGPDRDR